jgi:hypothetical protein
LGMSPVTSVQLMPSPVMSHPYNQMGLENCVSPHDVESNKYSFQLERHPDEFPSFPLNYNSTGWDHLNGGGMMANQGSFDYGSQPGLQGHPEFQGYEEEYNSDDSSGNNQHHDSRRSVGSSGEASNGLDMINQGSPEQRLPHAFEGGLHERRNPGALDGNGQHPQNFQYPPQANDRPNADIECLLATK